MTAVRSTVGVMDGLKVDLDLHQGSALLFAMVMERLTDKVKQESLWRMMFADDTMICSESRKQVEENMGRWRYTLE